ncbi:MAG: hypothetical protein ACTSQI_14170 [Candidatus Helarchaeota archaeon]
MNKVENHESFFRKNRNSTALANLLNRAWVEYENTIVQHKDLFDKFVKLVDMAAEYDETPSSNQLQLKLQNIQLGN